MVGVGKDPYFRCNNRRVQLSFGSQVSIDISFDDLECCKNNKEQNVRYICADTQNDFIVCKIID